METLIEISLKSADELQKETGGSYPKDSYHIDSNGNIIPSSLRRDYQNYSEAPPTRLLSMKLDLSYWLGFLDASGDHEFHKGAIGAWERIEKAYQMGKASHPISKSTNQSSIAKTEATT